MGSFTGAMGHTQFEPSDFEKFAADGDGDGKIDLENSIPDALASAAKQLRDYGWKPGKQWGFEVRIPRKLICTEASPDLKRSLADWLDLGLMPAVGAGISRDMLDDQAWLLLPAGAYGPGFLALENFQALRQYNASDLYVLFVGNLADRIAGGTAFERPWAKLQQFSSRDVEEVQTLLSKKKFYLDPVDGRPALSRDAPSDCTKARPAFRSIVGRRKTFSITCAVPTWRTSPDHKEAPHSRLRHSRYRCPTVSTSCAPAHPRARPFIGHSLDTDREVLLNH